MSYKDRHHEMDEAPILPDSEYRAAREELKVPGPGAAPEAVPQDVGASEEQLLYAKYLAAGMYLGLGLLLGTFALYATGVLAPAVPIQELPNYWTLSAHEYLEAIDHQFLHRDHLVTGWHWVGVLNRGDYLNFVGIALLAAVTIVCYLGILPTLLRKKDWIYSTIAVLEILILALAASGIVAVGH